MNWDWKLTTDEQELVEDNLGLVKHIVRTRFRKCYTMEKADLIQTGNMGLMSAAHFYLQRKQAGDIIDCVFATFAWPRITGHIRDTVKFRQKRKKLSNLLKKFIGEFYATNGYHINFTELATVFEIPEDFIRELFNETSAPENLDDLLAEEASWKGSFMVDDRLSPLDLLILKEEQLIRERNIKRRKIERRNRLRGLTTRQWVFARAVWEIGHQSQSTR